MTDNKYRKSIILNKIKEEKNDLENNNFNNNNYNYNDDIILNKTNFKIYNEWVGSFELTKGEFPKILKNVYNNTDQALKRNSISIKKNSVKKFYKSQNEFIERVLSTTFSDNNINIEENNNFINKKININYNIDDKVNSLTKSKRKELDLIEWAINLSFFANILLFLLKAFVAYLTGSMTVIASLTDSILDLLSGLVIYLTNYFKGKNEPYKYPQGKSRMEPIGVVIFASCMGVSSLQIIVESLKRLNEGITSNNPSIEFDLISQISLILVVIIKLILYIFCGWVYKKTKNVTVQAYKEDHINDSVSNIVGIICVYLAANISSLWFFDSLGALIISCLILYSWIMTGHEQALFLLGKSARPDFLKEITIMTFFHEGVLKVDTVRAYHFGPRYLVEVDIVLPEKMTVRDSHDIAEALQIEIEKLDNVERCFVHIDYEWLHHPEHKKT